MFSINSLKLPGFSAKNNKNEFTGFSLVELSIVLVIISLLTGGILSGQSLIHAAELRSIATEYEQYSSALHTFRDKYLAIPGDMKNATKFWGAEPAANCPGDQTTPSTTNATCNGNGDGDVIWVAYIAGLGGESHRFWQHLANAGLITGTFTGTHSAGGCNTDGSCNVTLGINAPASKLSNAGWSVGDTNPLYSFPGIKTRNMLFFGTINDFTRGNVLTTTEAWSLDKKVDDGIAGRGKLVSTFNNTYNSACASSDLADAEYLLSTNIIACSIAFNGLF